MQRRQRKLLVQNSGLVGIFDAGIYPNLRKLICSHNRITGFINLPPTLQELYCNNNQITELNDLPAGLIKLNCCNNQIQNLIVPETLDILCCFGNPLQEPFEFLDVRCVFLGADDQPALTDDQKDILRNHYILK
jgi:Leucine-rich repeat (LRR) protein